VLETQTRRQAQTVAWRLTLSVAQAGSFLLRVSATTPEMRSGHGDDMGVGRWCGRNAWAATGGASS